MQKPKSEPKPKPEKPPPPPPRMTSWRTRLDHPAIPPGRELHAAYFEPVGDEGGPRSTVVIQVPEASAVEVQHAFMTAARFQTRVLILTDTPKQATEFAELAATKLPLHKRVSYERASAGAIGRVI
jgi:hypothetical protein